MAKVRLGTRLLSEQELDLVTNIFRDPTATSHFVKFLQQVQKEISRQGDQSMELFLMNNDPQTRAMALLAKGKVGMLDDVIQLLNTVNK